MRASINAVGRLSDDMMNGTVEGSHEENRSGVDLDLLVRAQRGDKYAQEMLINQNKGLMYSYRQKFTRHLDEDDGMQVVMIGFWRAMMAYKLGAPMSLASYARFFIKEELRETKVSARMIDLPDGLQKLIRKIQKSPEFRDSSLDLIGYVSQNLDKFKRQNPESLIRAVRIYVRELYCLDSPIAAGIHLEMPVVESVDVNVEQQSLKTLMANFIFQLSDWEKFIVEQLYLNDTPPSAEKIANELGLTRQSVYNIKNEIFRRLAKVGELEFFANS